MVMVDDMRVMVLADLSAATKCELGRRMGHFKGGVGFARIGSLERHANAICMNAEGGVSVMVKWCGEGVACNNPGFAYMTIYSSIFN